MRSETLKVIRDVVINCILLLCVFALAVTASFLKPRTVGLFCDDETIQLPHGGNTVSSQLRVVGYLAPMICILLVELLERGHWAVRSYREILVMLFGAASTEALTNVAKAAVGRLRPHFLDTCRPENCTAVGYVTNYVCTGDPELVEEARRSFPSGHASLSAYVMIFTALYLNRRITLASSLLIPFLQFLCILITFYAGITRVPDHQHHSTDVMAGFFIGGVIAVVTDLYLHKITKPAETCTLKRSRSI